MVYKLSIAVVLAFLLFGKVSAQKNSNDPIPEEIKSKIQEKVEHDILWYRAALCPKVDFERFVTRGYTNNIIIMRRDPKEIFLRDSVGYHWQDYKMIMDITRWLEVSHYQDFYLVQKEDMNFTNGEDTLSFDICNNYFKYDKRLYNKSFGKRDSSNGKWFLFSRPDILRV